MKDRQRVPIESRTELRSWLRADYASTESIWLVVFKRYVLGKYVSREDVIEEALYFGWIDSLTRKLDADRRSRFSRHAARTAAGHGSTSGVLRRCLLLV